MREGWLSKIFKKRFKWKLTWTSPHAEEKYVLNITTWHSRLVFHFFTASVLLENWCSNHHYLILPLFFQDNICSTFQHQQTSGYSTPATSRSPDPPSLVQLQIHPEYHSIARTSLNELFAATTDAYSPTPAGDRTVGAPGRSRQRLTCGSRGSEVVKELLDGDSSVSLSGRLLQDRQLKVVEPFQLSPSFVSNTRGRCGVAAASLNLKRT